MGSWERKIGKEKPRKEDWREIEKVPRHYKKSSLLAVIQRGFKGF